MDKIKERRTGEIWSIHGQKFDYLLGRFSSTYIRDNLVPREDVGEEKHDKAIGQIEIISSFMVIPSKLTPETGVL